MSQGPNFAESNSSMWKLKRALQYVVILDTFGENQSLSFTKEVPVDAAYLPLANYLVSVVRSHRISHAESAEIYSSALDGKGESVHQGKPKRISSLSSSIRDLHLEQYIPMTRLFFLRLVQ